MDDHKCQGENCLSVDGDTILFWGLLQSAMQQINDLRAALQKQAKRIEALEADHDLSRRPTYYEGMKDLLDGLYAVIAGDIEELFVEPPGVSP